VCTGHVLCSCSTGYNYVGNVCFRIAREAVLYSYVGCVCGLCAVAYLKTSFNLNNIYNRVCVCVCVCVFSVYLVAPYCRKLQ